MTEASTLCITDAQAITDHARRFNELTMEAAESLSLLDTSVSTSQQFYDIKTNVTGPNAGQKRREEERDSFSSSWEPWEINLPPSPPVSFPTSSPPGASAEHSASTLHVQGVSLECATDAHIIEQLSSVGCTGIKSVHRKTDSDGKSLGAAFVEFHCPEDAAKALGIWQTKGIDTMRISWATKRSARNACANSVRVAPQLPAFFPSAEEDKRTYKEKTKPEPRSTSPLSECWTEPHRSLSLKKRILQKAVEENLFQRPDNNNLSEEEERTRNVKAASTASSLQTEDSTWSYNAHADDDEIDPAVTRRRCRPVRKPRPELKDEMSDDEEGESSSESTEDRYIGCGKRGATGATGGYDDEDRILMQCQQIVDKYDRPGQEDTAVRYLLDILRNTRRTRPEVPKKCRNPPGYEDIFRQLGMKQDPKKSAHYHCWQLPDEGTVQRAFFDELRAEGRAKLGKKVGRKIVDNNRGRIEEDYEEEEEEQAASGNQHQRGVRILQAGNVPPRRVKRRIAPSDDSDSSSAEREPAYIRPVRAVQEDVSLQEQQLKRKRGRPRKQEGARIRKRMLDADGDFVLARVKPLARDRAAEDKGVGPAMKRKRGRPRKIRRGEESEDCAAAASSVSVVAPGTGLAATRERRILKKRAFHTPPSPQRGSPVAAPGAANETDQLEAMEKQMDVMMHDIQEKMEALQEKQNEVRRLKEKMFGVAGAK